MAVPFPHDATNHRRRRGFTVSAGRFRFRKPVLTSSFKRDSWKHLPRVVPYLRRHRKLTGASGGLLFIGVLISLLQPWPLAFILDSALGSKPPTGFASRLVSGSRKHMVMVGAAAGLAVAILANGLHVLAEYVNTKLDNKLRFDFRKDLFERALQLPLSYHDSHRAGYFAQNINTHTNALGRLVVDVPPLVESLLTLTGMFVIAYIMDPVLAALALGVAPFIYYSTVYYGRHVEPKLIRTRNAEGLSLSIVHEAMQMLRVILTFRREGYEKKRFADQAEEAIKSRIDVTVKQTLFSLAINVLTAAGSAVVLGVGAMHVLNGDLTVGRLLVLMGYIAAVYKPLQTISFTMGSWQELLVDFGLALQIMDHEVEIGERDDAITLAPVYGAVSFQNVSFAYPNRVGTLEKVSFSVPPGAAVAIVGPTGAGKTTLVNLIPRLYDPTSGSVRLDGHDVRDLTLDCVRNSVATVLQEPMLFLETIAANIRYGRLEATMEEVMEAARQANAHDFITSLPDGYETRLGERGALLSGGERQRICVARAFLKNAPILILDEPTSSIDSRTEGVILDALDRLMVGRTTFIVAHRLSTIRRATYVLVMDQGRLVEQGTHEQLLALPNSLYRQLWTAQAPGLIAGSSTETEDVSMTLHPEGGSPSPTEAPVTLKGAAPSQSSAPASKPGIIAAPAQPGRPKAVVLGMMSKMPVAGAVWQTVHYLIGLERLGYDAYYVEAHARTPKALMRSEGDDSAELAARFIAGVMNRFGLPDRWAFHALHDDGRLLGMSEAELARVYREAAIIVNLHGGTVPRPEHYETGRLVLVETDPCELQVELHDGRQEAIDFLEPHAAFFTFGENYGRPGCGLPVSSQFTFVPTRQPVLVDLWEARGRRAGSSFTTIANWRQTSRDITLDGRTYQWSKDQQFRMLLDLPAKSGAAFELALSSFDDEDRELLERHGWAIRSGLEVSASVDTYRAFIASSLAEFTVAKEQNVQLRSGWFSDRSATYLASGRPVITQDTGFGVALPTGTGLLSFDSPASALEAVARVQGDYGRHSRAAHGIARDYFDSDVVLGALLDHLGLPVRRRPAPRATPIPADFVLTPTSRRPLRLDEATEARALARATTGPADDHGWPADDDVEASVIVVVHNSLACTRMCLESVLGSAGPRVELIVVDNASTDGTPAFLRRLAELDSRVRVVRSDSNAGFATAANMGLAASKRPLLVLLNNDTIVAPGWLAALGRHLVDPAVGAVGPVTNRIGNEAELPAAEAAYTTYGEFVDAAATRLVRHAGKSFPIPMLALFCTAFRRDVVDRIGPLDEGFGLGTFEDDDYAMRLRRAGFRLVCADDVLVHHFGEGTIGELAPDGTYGQLFETNRRRFEKKWNVEWKPHQRRDPEAHAKLVDHICTTAGRMLPAGAYVAVATRGDAQLLKCAQRAEHFPQGSDGGWAGYNPLNTAAIVTELRAMVNRGVTHLLVPSWSLWWFDHYTGLTDTLKRLGRVSHTDTDFVLYTLDAERPRPLTPSPMSQQARPAARPRIEMPR
jgi:ATP-binding cassette, subfamily B, bacterial